MRRLSAALVAAFVFVSTLANAVPVGPIVIHDDPGGDIYEYSMKYRNWKANELIVRLEGECASACTLLLGYVPRENVCATPKAVMAFHSASHATGDYSLAGTLLLWSAYPHDVQQMLRARGWSGPTEPHPDLIKIKAAEIFKTCAA